MEEEAKEDITTKTKEEEVDLGYDVVIIKTEIKTEDDTEDYNTPDYTLSDFKTNRESDQDSTFDDDNNEQNEIFSSLVVPDIQLKKEEWECTQCSKRFTDLRRLQSHQFIHKRLFKCDVCDRDYFQLCELNKHKKIHSSEVTDICDRCVALRKVPAEKLAEKKEEYYICTLCRVDFVHLRCLNIHIKASHTGEKPFVCGVCEKCFVRPNYVRAHQRLHMEKPYKCDECSRCFYDNPQLESHKKIHPKNKRFKCEYCKKRFAEVHNYYKHERIHNGLFTMIPYEKNDH